MKYYLKSNVWDEAKERVSFIFDEFDKVIVSTSGGKDSTVVFELAYAEAKRRNRLPLDLFFIDQEGEYQSAIDYLRRCMTREGVSPKWLQMPMKLSNATSVSNVWLECWEESVEWIREKEEFAITDNVYGTDRFHKIFNAYLQHHYKGQKVCYLAGVRAEESPSRLAGLTVDATYKWVTWASRKYKTREHYTFYPLYDWRVSDIWKAIHDNEWDYCDVYNQMYRYGVKPHQMRVSNLHHETAVSSLFNLHEIEPHTWVRLTKRLKGINQANHFQQSDIFQVQDLPKMFKDWRDYRDYLTDNLLPDSEYKDKIKHRWKHFDDRYKLLHNEEHFIKKQVHSILTNDWEGEKIDHYIKHPSMQCFELWRNGRLKIRNTTKKMYLRHIPPLALAELKQDDSIR